MTFRPASRTEAKPLIGLYAESGCGKTWSSLLLARGFVGSNGKIGMIETEGGRGEANAGREPVGQYLVRPIRDNFSPMEYGLAISEAESANLDALIVDSASHEWEGAGGVLSMAADNQAKGLKGVLVWQQPKILHQRHFMLKLMQTPIPLVIVCMRAKYPMEQVKGAEWKRSEKLEPKQAEDILSEMFVHAWIDADHKLHVTKYTLPEYAGAIKDGERITIDTGRALAQCARGGTSSPATASPQPAKAAPSDMQPNPADGAVTTMPVRSRPPQACEADDNHSDQPHHAGAGTTDINDPEIIDRYDVKLADAASRGLDALKAEWARVPKEIQPTLNAAVNRRHKPRAIEVDAAKVTANE